jgi:hypothetical protein
LGRSRREKVLVLVVRNDVEGEIVGKVGDRDVLVADARRCYRALKDHRGLTLDRPPLMQEMLYVATGDRNGDEAA